MQFAIEENTKRENRKRKVLQIWAVEKVITTRKKVSQLLRVEIKIAIKIIRTMVKDKTESLTFHSKNCWNKKGHENPKAMKNIHLHCISFCNPFIVQW